MRPRTDRNVIGRTLGQLVHELLEKQLTRAARKSRGGHVNYEHLLKLVDEAYRERDRERRLRAHAFRTMNKEMSHLNERVRQEAEARFRAVLNAAGDAIAITNNYGELEHHNQVFEQLTRLADCVVPNSDIWQFLPELVAAERRVDHLEVRSVIGLERATETIFLRSDGDRVPVSITVSPAGGDRDDEYLWLIHDISELKERERRLAQTTAILTATLENIQQGIAMVGPDLRIIAYNKPMLEMWNLPEQMYIDGTTIEETTRLLAQRGEYGDGDVEELVRARMAIMLSDTPQQYEWRRPDGRVISAATRNTPEGNTVITFTDITDQKTHERELAETSAVLRATLDNTEQGITFVDEKLRIIAYNRSILDMYGLSDDSLEPGMNVEDYLRLIIEKGEWGHGDPDEIIRDRLRSIDGGQSHVVEYMRGDGRVVEIRGQPTPEGGVVSVHTDVTDRYRVQAQIQEAKQAAEVANRSKSEFLANVSHELRTPLNAVIGYSEAMLHELLGEMPASYKDYADHIHESGKHLLSLINDILDLSKIEAGKMEFAEETVDLKAAIDACLRIMGERASLAGVALHSEFDDQLPCIRADGRSIKQILLNLISNAVKFTPRDGGVTVSAGADDDGGLRLAVVDTGIGMKRTDLKKALTPFGQVDSVFNRTHNGTGLGLPLAKKLVELQDGAMEISSEPGAGTTVEVLFPISRVAPDVASSPVETIGDNAVA